MEHVIIANTKEKLKKLIKTQGCVIKNRLHLAMNAFSGANIVTCIKMTKNIRDFFQ